MAEMRRTSGFDSYEALRLEHMRRSRGAAARRRAAGDGPYNPAAVLEFIEAIKSSGAVIGSDAERQSAQGMLDYWAAEYVNSSEVDPMTWTAPVLAPHQEAKASDEAEAELATDADADHRHAELGRQIRIAALARQWRDSGGYAGYLLTGQALDDTRRAWAR